MASEIYFGNAAADGEKSGSWILGNFLGKYLDDQNSPRITGGVEIKWGVHKAGILRSVWSLQKTESTVVVLVRGKIRMQFPDKEYTLSKEGDYLIWGPNTPHKTNADEDCVVLTIRWPSVPGDSQELDKLP